MGIVVSQSIKNTIITYVGFAIGGINVLFLFTHFMSDEYFGLIQYIFSTANIMMPLMALGLHNTIVKFYSSFKTRASQNSFLTLVLILPLFIVIPIGLIGVFSYKTVGIWLSKENPIIEDYVWLIYFSAVFFAYFEIFYAWSKVNMKSVFGNFMKETFHRIITTILLFALYFDIINVEQLIYMLVGGYFVRLVIMAVYALNLKPLVIRFKNQSKLSQILKYSFLIIIAGSIANIILEIDKFMIAFYIPIENVAYYAVAVYIASVIGVPSRAMHQITNPLTAQLLNEKNKEEIKVLYRKSSLNLLIISGLIFLLIILNINQLYLLIPAKFGGGLVVVFLIGLAKLYDNLLGNNNAILFNSDYYRIVLALGIGLVLIIVLLNSVFIPKYGAIGAAYATFMSIFLYNSFKLFFVRLWFRMIPFTFKTVKAFGLICLSFLVFYFWDLPFYPIVNITLKTFLIVGFYLFLAYYLNLSQEVSSLIDKVKNYRKRI